MKNQVCCPNCGSADRALIIAKAQKNSFVNFPAAVAAGLNVHNIDINCCLNCGVVFVPQEYLEKLRQDLEESGC